MADAIHGAIPVLLPDEAREVSEVEHAQSTAVGGMWWRERRTYVAAAVTRLIILVGSNSGRDLLPAQFVREFT